MQYRLNKAKQTDNIFHSRQVKTKKKQFAATPETLDIQRSGVVFYYAYNFYKK